MSKCRKKKSRSSLGISNHELIRDVVTLDIIGGMI